MNKPELQKWIQNTAILFTYGLGNQRPLETLGQFDRTKTEDNDYWIRGVAKGAIT